MPYAGAFQCETCPRNNDPAAARACPAWWETIWTDDKGNTDVRKGCAFTQLQQYQIEVIKAANHSAASCDKIANELRQGFMRLGILLDGKLTPPNFLALTNGRGPDNTAIAARAGKLFGAVSERSEPGC
jgi:hypothetical protein